MEFSLEHLRIAFAILIGRIGIGSIILYNSFSFPWKKYAKSQFFFYSLCVFLAIIGTILLPLNIAMVWENQIEETAPPIQIFLDVSLSMTAQDITPSRFQVARQWIQSIIENTPWSNISLIAFSGLPLVRIPYTHDYAAFAQKLSATSMASFPPDTAFLGTALGDAMLLGLRNMEQQWYTTGTWIIISDWDNNKWYDPAALLSGINNLPLTIHTIAIGQDNVLLGYDENNISVMTDFDTTFLQTISTITSGLFFHILEKNDITESFAAIREHIQENKYIVSYPSYISLNRYILFYLIVFAIFHAVYVSIYCREFFVLWFWEK